MKYKFLNAKILSSVSLLILSLNSYAQSGLSLGNVNITGAVAEIINSINNVSNTILSSIGAAETIHAQQIYEPDPALPQTLIANTNQNSAKEQISSNAQSNELIAIHQQLTQANSLTTPLSSIVGSDTYTPTSLVASIFGNLNKNQNSAMGDVNFNLSSLLGPNAYNTNTQLSANNFIYFAANMNQPLTTINWNTLTPKQKLKLQTDPVGQDYRVALRSLVAARSVGIDNLYYLMAERTPVPNLGEKAGMDIKDASPLQVKEFIATHRTADPKWYEDMSKASPATIQRETLFVLAEIERQLYDLHRDNERAIAALSLIELQGTYNSQMALQQKEGAVKGALGIKDASMEQVMQQLGVSNSSNNDNDEVNNDINQLTNKSDKKPSLNDLEKARRAEDKYKNESKDGKKYKPQVNNY